MPRTISFFRAAALLPITLLLVVGLLGAEATPAMADATGTVQTGGPNLRIRDGAGLSGNVIGYLADGTTVDIVCQVVNDSPDGWVDGNWGPTDIWDQVGPVYQGWAFVSDGFVYTGSNGLVAPFCKG
jgi:hypothetical protein